MCTQCVSVSDKQLTRQLLLKANSCNVHGTLRTDNGIEKLKQKKNLTTVRKCHDACATTRIHTVPRNNRRNFTQLKRSRYSGSTRNSCHCQLFRHEPIRVETLAVIPIDLYSFLHYFFPFFPLFSYFPFSLSCFQCLNLFPMFFFVLFFLFYIFSCFIRRGDGKAGCVQGDAMDDQAEEVGRPGVDRPRKKMKVGEQLGVMLRE